MISRQEQERNRISDDARPALQDLRKAPPRREKFVLGACGASDMRPILGGRPIEGLPLLEERVEAARLRSATARKRPS